MLATVKNRLKNLNTKENSKTVSHLLVVLLLIEIGLAITGIVNIIDHKGATFHTEIQQEHITVDPDINTVTIHKNSSPDEIESATMSVDMRKPQMLDHLLVIFINSAQFFVFAIGIEIARRILKSVQTKDPFNLKNVQRLRLLAAVSAAWFVVEILTDIATVALNTRAGLQPYTVFGIDVPLPIFLVVFWGLYALAEVFKTGVTLREDNEGVV